MLIWVVIMYFSSVLYSYCPKSFLRTVKARIHTYTNVRSHMHVSQGYFVHQFSKKVLRLHILGITQITAVEGKCEIIFAVPDTLSSE